MTDEDELSMRIKECTELTVLNEKLKNELEERKHAEEALRECTAELEKRNAQIETMLKAFVGRELRMVELKKQIAKLNK